jgi:3-hydroxyacyl-[acyl-carrier-protein] dehydratase
MAISCTDRPLTIALDHPSFAGHFPGRPIVPGVVLLDLAQRALETACGATVCAIASAKFLSPAIPGDKLSLDFMHSEANASFISFTIRCESRTIASGRFQLTT